MRKTYAIAAALAAMTAIACGSAGEDTAGPGAQGEPEKASAGKKIVMEVTASKSKKASVTYGLNADQSQDNEAKLPWKKELTSAEALTIASLVAQNSGSGEISCKISVDGKVVKENKSKGEYAVVTCSADDLGI
jgi:hypothetical protein